MTNFKSNFSKPNVQCVSCYSQHFSSCHQILSLFPNPKRRTTEPVYPSASRKIIGPKMAADPGMETSEIGNSRKRPSDRDIENGVTKKSHYAGGGGDGTYHFKMLIPSVAAGAIIGKGGETIAQLQKDAGAKVKMSKANDFYPGSSERVCLITGSVDAIVKVLMFIMEKIKEKPDPNTMAAVEFDNKNVLDRSRTQIKILVPNSTAGMIIGKGGNYIKQIKEESGAYIQISQKAKDQTLHERCITVNGDLDSNKTACFMILSKIVEDPQSGTCLNISYADVSGPVANYNPTGSPYADNSSVGGMLLGGGGLNLSLNLGYPSGGSSMSTQLLEQIKLTLHASGYSDDATGEIVAAMITLARYGILGMGLGLGAESGASGLSGGNYFPSSSPTPHGGPLDHYGEGGASSSSYDLSFNSNSYGLGTGQQKSSDMKGDQKKLDIEIGENIVGAILGPRGRSLIAIHRLSGANIQISKKGIFAPGTRNRIVTIQGTPHEITTAQYLIEDRIREEETKRARHNTL